MQLNIIKPTQKKNSAIVWIDLETPAGNFVIQEEHAPMIITLSKNSKITYCLTNGKHEIIDYKMGIAHITRDSVTLLLQE